MFFFSHQKGCGYHLDLFVLAILIEICSIMGLPWFVAATVLSINHVNSLKLESECAAPGEKPQFLGVREQRLTHILIFLMIGCSVLLTPMLKHIPMPVLFGVFLYMGVASLKGLQFFDRILIMFMPVKYQPDYMFLRQVQYNDSSSSPLDVVIIGIIDVVMFFFFLFCFVSGTTEARPHVHSDTTHLSCLPLDHQVIQLDINSLPVNGTRT